MPPEHAPRDARPLLVCADDFGLARGIDDAIAALARAGRIGALSCLANGPAWRADAPRLAELRRGAQVGLHLNLTEGRPLSGALARHWPRLPSLPWLIVAAQLRRLPLDAVDDEFSAQWQAFVDAAGCAPDFIDGHQHVHHLPGLRPLMLRLARRRSPALPVRCTAPVLGPGDAVKRWLIERTGGRALARRLRREGLPHNRALLGAYDFVDADYRQRMRGWLAQVPAGGALLFCHPGQASPDAPSDAIGAARQREYAYLAGDDYPRDLAGAGVVLAPVWR